MPRLTSQILNQARCIDPLLARLLPVCRDLSSARNELRWLKEYVSSNVDARAALSRLCSQRARGRPLQYILGSEFFGDLEIRCKDGVFIPRQETAHSVAYLVKRLHQEDLSERQMLVVDVCAGTGAMSLLFAHLYDKRQIQGELDSIHIVGVDISQSAVRLARQNAMYLYNSRLLSTRVTMDYIQGDVFTPGQLWAMQPMDVLLCNPPYISKRGFWRDTARSVRTYEPRAALIPCIEQSKGFAYPEDAFYHTIINQRIDPKVILFEVAHLQQALRVARLASKAGWKCEIWRDFPDSDSLQNSNLGDQRALQDKSIHQDIIIRGLGEGRSVYLWRS